VSCEGHRGLDLAIARRKIERKGGGSAIEAGRSLTKRKRITGPRLDGGRKKKRCALLGRAKRFQGKGRREGSWGPPTSTIGGSGRILLEQGCYVGGGSDNGTPFFQLKKESALTRA